jgi:hypothetical protein
MSLPQRDNFKSKNEEKKVFILPVKSLSFFMVNLHMVMILIRL